MAMREYRVTIAGVDTTVQLSDEDAERAGVTGNTARSGGDVSNKARSTEPGLSGTRRRRKSDDAGDDE